MTVTASIGADAVNVLLYVWFASVLVSVVYVCFDAFTKNPELTVMKWGWVLVTLFIGPIGAAIYVLSCKEPRPGTHERFVAPLWKQSLGSTIHCVAGDATGIVVAAIITTAIGLPMWGDTIVEYVARVRLRPARVPGAVHARHARGQLPRRREIDGAARMAFDELAVMAGMVAVMVIIRSHAAGTSGRRATSGSGASGISLAGARRAGGTRISRPRWRVSRATRGWALSRAPTS